VLVSSEVALAAALLVSSILLVRTVHHMTSVSLGVDADDVLTASVQLPSTPNSTWAMTADTFQRVIRRVREQPGVTSAGLSNFLPLEVGWRVPFLIDGQPPPARPEDAPQAQVQSVSDGYFETMRGTKLSGRLFTDHDTRTSTPVVIVNESFARKFFAGHPIGARVKGVPYNIGPLGRNLMDTRPVQALNTMDPPAFEIVGVVADIRNAPIAEPTDPEIYLSAQQYPFLSMSVAIRAVDPATGLTALRSVLHEVAPLTPISQPQTWGERFRTSSAEPRLLMTLLVFFGSVAGLLAAVGVYGLLSWSVALRRRELAIRLTLGANPRGIGGVVVRHTIVLVGAGLIGGYVIVRLAERLLSRVVFGISASDAGSSLTACAVLLVVSILAASAPALRAMRVDPVEGLRIE